MNTGASSLLRLAILLCTLSATAAHAQDFISFCNACLPSPPDRLVRDVHGNPLVGTNYVAQLYLGGTAATLTPHTGAAARFRPPTTNLPGTWTGGSSTRDIAPNSGPIILQVRVWDRNAGTTYEQASQNTTGLQYGQSDAFVYEPCGSPPRSGDCTLMLGFRGFTLRTNAPPAPPGALAIREHSGGGVEILYEGTHTIERAASLRGPWVILATQSGPLIDQAAASDAARFYRINDNGSYSENAVGFYRVSLCNGYSLIANQLNAPGGNGISNLLPSPPDGMRIYKYNPATGGFILAPFIAGEWEGDPG